MALTIEDIAKLSDTSKSTVSRFLNGGSVSAKTSERIKKAINETGFEMNLSASRLKTKKSHLIGVLFEGFGSFSISKMMIGINKKLQELSYQPFFMYDDLSEDNKINSMKALVSQGVDGIILGSGVITKEHLKYISSLPIPVLILGQRSEFVPYCKIDDYKAGQLLANYLVNGDYKKIAYIGRSEIDKAVGVERKNGFCDVIKADKNKQLFLFESHFTIESSYKQAEEVLKVQPDLIVGATDRIIMGIIKYLNEQGIRIPDQIAVAGFGDNEYGEILNPKLTSVFMDYSTLGEKSAETIVKLINNEPVEKNYTDFCIKLRKRESA